MCTLICSRLARNEGDQAAALGADARGSALVRSKCKVSEGHTRGKIVLIVDEDLAAQLEV